MEHVLVLTDEQFKSIMMTTTLAIAEDVSRRHWTVSTAVANHVMECLDDDYEVEATEWSEDDACDNNDTCDNNNEQEDENED